MTNSQQENLRAGGSNPSSRTNFPATETPIALAYDMAVMANIGVGERVLEPSAGFGPLVFSAFARGAEVTAIELNEECVKHLANRCWCSEIFHADFLTWKGEGIPLFDAVLMCPPKNSIPHIDHALTFLKPEGRLVALIRRDSNNIEKYLDNYKPLPYDMFQMNGKNIETGLIVI